MLENRKNIIVAIFFAMAFSSYEFSFSQNSGRGFNYQAVARGIDGIPKSNADLEIKFTFFTNSNSTPQWQEVQNATTNDFGLFNLTIGKGTKIQGIANEFKDLDFSLEMWLRVEINDEGAFREISYSQLLSVPYAEVAGNASVIPAGSIIPFAGDSIPDGWLKCDGTQVQREKFPHLYDAIGTAWGAGDGITTFHLPDLGGLFLRGVDYNNKYDEDRQNRVALNDGGNTGKRIGSLQLENFRRHKHTGKTANSGLHSHEIITRKGNGDETLDTGIEQGDGSEHVDTERDGNHSHTFESDETGGLETRPDNAYVNYIIKY